MPRVLLLLPTTTYRTHAFMAAARRLGVQVTVGSEEASTMTGLNPAGLLTLSFDDPERAARQALQFAAQHPIDAIVSVDDQVTAVGAVIAHALGLPSNSAGAALAARNKFHMRELLARSGVPQPQFKLCSLEEDPADLARKVTYPCVVKPLMLAASQGVIRANNDAEFLDAVARLSAILRSKGQWTKSEGTESCSAPSDDDSSARSPDMPTPHSSGSSHHTRHAPPHQFLVEEFIPGSEVAVEGLLTRGKLRVLALFDKPDPLDGPFFEETIYVTPSRLTADLQAEIAECTSKACQALGLVHGPVHAELRLNSNPTPHSELATGNSRRPTIIEVNPRSIGGLCSRVLRFGTGLTLEELIIRHAIDESFAPPTREDRAAGVMMIPIPRAGVLREVCGLDEAKQVSGIEEITISAHRGQKLVPLPEGSLYLGFIFARGESPDFIELALREAHNRLRFDIV